MKKNFTVIGHRGIAALYPENTIPSFVSAMENGVDAIEFDVHPTRDGHGAVREMTLAELKALDFGSYKSPKFAGTRIPTLEETLEAVWGKQSGFPLLIELKEDNAACTRRIVETVRRFHGVKDVLILSFLPEQLRVVHELEPNIPLQGFPHRYLKASCNDLYALVRKVCVWNSEANASETDYFQHLGLQVDVYPVDTEEHLERVLPLKHRFDHHQ